MLFEPYVRFHTFSALKLFCAPHSHVYFFKIILRFEMHVVHFRCSFVMNSHIHLSVTNYELMFRYVAQV